MNCPNKSSREWNTLSRELGEKIANRIFVANGEELPSLEEVKSIVIKYKNTLEGVSNINFSTLAEDKAEKLKDFLQRVGSDFKGDFQDIVNDSAKFINDGSYTGITSDNGILAAMYTNGNLDTEEHIKKLADKTYAKHPDGSALIIESISSTKPITKEEFIENKMVEVEERRVRGKAIELMINLLIEPNADKRNNIVKQFSELQSKLPDVMSEMEAYNWILQDGDNGFSILRKLGIDIEDLKSNEKISTQINLASKELGLLGIADYIIDRGDNWYTIGDIKAGKSFMRESSSTLLKHGRGTNTDAYETQLTKAKLQLTWYAILLKIKNPKAQIASLDLAWIPTEWNLANNPTGLTVEIADYLELIEKSLRIDNPELHAKMLAISPNIFTASYYVGNIKGLGQSPNKRESARKYKGDSHVENMIEQLITQKLLFKPKGDALEDIKREVNDQFQYYVTNSARAIVSLNELDNTSDLSMSYYFGSLGSIKNPYVKLWQQVIEKGFHNTSIEYYKQEAVFNELMRPIYIRYLATSGTAPSAIAQMMNTRMENWKSTGLTKFLAITNDKAFSSWAYVTDTSGNTRLALTIDELMENGKNHTWILDGKGQVRNEFVNLINFLNEFYSSVLDSDRTDSFVNKVAYTYKLKTGETRSKSELDIINSSTNRRLAPFKYVKGFFPKFAKTNREVSGDMFNEIGDVETIGEKAEAVKKSINIRRKRLFTSFNQNTFEEYRNTTEQIPLLGLGSSLNNNTLNFSIDLEHQFKSFAKSYYFKKNMTKAYSFGEAIKMYIELKAGENEDEAYLENTSDWVDTQLQSLLRNRLKDLPSLFSRATYVNPNNVGKNIEPGRWISYFSNISAQVQLGYQPIKGLRNALTINMMAIREGVKNEIVLKHKDKWAGVNEHFITFSVNDMHIGNAEALGVQVSGMKGELNKNKLWQMAMMFNYQPSISPYRGNQSNYVTGSSGFFTKEFQFLAYSIAEEQLSLSILRSQLNHMKIDKPGHVFHGTSLYDMYEPYEYIDPTTGVGVTQYKWKDDPATGKPFVRFIIQTASGEPIEITEITPEEISTLRYTYEKMQGGYGPMDRTILESNVMGRAFLQFKRYIPALVMANWNSYGENKTIGYWEKTGQDENGQDIVKWAPKITEGRWKTVLGWAFQAIYLNKVFNKQSQQNQTIQNGQEPSLNQSYYNEYAWANLSMDQKENIVDFMLTFISTGTMWALQYMAFSGVPEDNKIKRIVDLMIKNYSQQWNLWEQVRDFQRGSEIAALSNIVKLASSSMQLSLSSFLLGLDSGLEAIGYDIDDSQYLTKDDDMRGLNDFLKSNPYTNSLYTHANLLEDYYQLIDEE